jgi:hypothetical protein
MVEEGNGGRREMAEGNGGGKWRREMAEGNGGRREIAGVENSSRKKAEQEKGGAGKRRGLAFSEFVKTARLAFHEVQNASSRLPWPSPR